MLAERAEQTLNTTLKMLLCPTSVELKLKDRKSILFLSSVHQPLEGPTVKHKVNMISTIKRLVNDCN